MTLVRREINTTSPAAAASADPNPARTPDRPPVLSIIIPALNEAETLPKLLGDLRLQQDLSFEILVGDGGSVDDTQTVAESHGATFIAAPRGRGCQMNMAAAHARGQHLLFVHADSRLDDPRLLSAALVALKETERSTALIAGHFPLRFIRTHKGHALAYRYLEAKSALNRVNTTNGDQGMLLSKAFFEQMGGFDQQLPFLEDQRLAEQVRLQGQWITLPGYLATSARRFESEGFHRRYLLMGMIMGMHSIGMHTFFRRASGAYRVQQETGKLLLSPFFSLLWSMVRNDWRWQGTAHTFYRLGRYIRQNSWQMFFFADVCLQPLLGRENNPLLAFHDRFCAPCLRFRFFDAFSGLLCFIWYMGVLTLWFRLIEGWPGHKSAMP